MPLASLYACFASGNASLERCADMIVDANREGRQRENLDAQADALINRLESLEQQADALVEEISRRYHIPPDDIRRSLGLGSIIWNPTLGDIFYSYKKQKLIEAEQKGYKEARGFYETAIENLKKEIAGSKAYFDEAFRELYSLICDVFEDIAKKEMEIADFIIILQGGQE